MGDGAERTERATPRRREEARRHGQIVLSPEVSPIAVLLTALALGVWGAPHVLGHTRVWLGSWLAAVGPLAARDDATWPAIARALTDVARLLVPFFLATVVVGVGAVVAQVGWAATPELVMPDAARLSPGRGVQRIFSLAGAANLVKAVAKIMLVVLVAYRVGLATGLEAIATPAMTPGEILALAGRDLARLLLMMAAALGALGALDYLWQRWRHERSLRMTRHEVREEQKETEGDPHVRARFRRAHRELAKRRMLTDVAHADVTLRTAARREAC
jgi:flagellar biosynthetic protein FlhB